MRMYNLAKQKKDYYKKIDNQYNNYILLPIGK